MVYSGNSIRLLAIKNQLQVKIIIIFKIADFFFLLQSQNYSAHMEIQNTDCDG